jgi:NADH dehydrogenase
MIEKKISVTLVNPENYFLFTPMLHEVATGGVSARNVIEPIRNAMGPETGSFIQGRVEHIDSEGHKVKTSVGTLPYDMLVLSQGSVTDFYGNIGAEKHAFRLKTLSDAMTLKDRFISLFEKASITSDETERRRLLSFVVVGGGPTGVELAAEMSEFLFGTLAGHYYRSTGLDRDVRITLVERGPRVLSAFPSSMSERALETLRKKRVEVILNADASDVTADDVSLGNGKTVPAATTVWVAGVRPRTVPGNLILEVGRSDRILVDEFLRARGHEDVFVLGDAARFETAPGAALPPLAQVATKQAAVVAENIVRIVGKQPLKPFSYRHDGTLISLGKGMALAEIGRFRFRGRFAWWLWRTIYLSKFISITKKIKVAFEWTILLFTQRDISRIE